MTSGTMSWTHRSSDEHHWRIWRNWSGDCAPVCRARRTRYPGGLLSRAYPAVLRNCRVRWQCQPTGAILRRAADERLGVAWRRRSDGLVKAEEVAHGHRDGSEHLRTCKLGER